MQGKDRQLKICLSLAGVYRTKRKNAVPVALNRFLEEHPLVERIRLHLDNDEIGRDAAKGIVSGLQSRYTVLTSRLPTGKDVNGELKIRVGMKREERESRDNDEN